MSLCHEIDPPDGQPAIMILLDSRKLRRMLGAEPAWIGNAPQREPPAWWRLGAIRRTDPGLDSLQARVADRDAPLPAFLDWERYAWRVRVYAPDPDAGDCDIRF